MRFPTDLLQACWFLAGPTACGKTSTALVLAKSINAEIVALDSMSVYRGMDIGTAKATAAERQAVPHHLIDVVDPHEHFSVSDYMTAAIATCKQIVARSRTPLFVGGTGLYLRAILRGVFDGPSADPDYRTQLEAAARDAAPEFLHEQLKTVDPAAADKLHPNDHRRLIRALEVFHVTGRPLSEQQTHPPLSGKERPANVYWLSPPRAWLHERINRRVDSMLQAGLLQEVQTLLATSKGVGTAAQALGYRELIAHLNGETSLEDAIETIKIRTRQFAKRQHTWFRNISECREISITGTESAEQLADTILTAASAAYDHPGS